MVQSSNSVVNKNLQPELGPPTTQNTKPPLSVPTGLADTGCTGHFLSLETKEQNFLQNIKMNPSPIHVEEPSGNIISSTHTATVPWHQAPASACQGHLFPALQGKCLVSIAQFCNAGCTAMFTPTQVLILHNGNVIIKGTRCPTTGLWKVPLATNPSNPHQTNAITLPSKVPDMVAFSHATLFSPRVSTLQQALDLGYEVKHFPGLTSASLKKHPPNSVPTAKGHLDQIRAGKQSTQPKLTEKEEEAQLKEIYFPQPLHKLKDTKLISAVPLSTSPLKALVKLVDQTRVL